MNRYLLLILISLLFIAPFVSNGQNRHCILSGKVLDDMKQPVSTGDVFLLTTDSVVVKSSIINNGKFSLDPVQSGNYLLNIFVGGYDKIIQHVDLLRDTQVVIELNPKIVVLDPTTVTASKHLFINKNGNLTINIDNSIFASIPDPVELLSKLPGIQVSPDEKSLSVIGKGEPLIYIGEEKATMNDLASLPVSDIKSVEIINNPSVKYEASGRVVILITLKKNKKEGIKVELSETAKYRKFYNNYTGINLSYKRKKLEIKGNFQYNQLKPWESNSYDFLIDTQHTESKYSLTSVGKRREFIAGAGLFYQINDDDYFSVSANLRTQREPFSINTNSYLRQGAIQNSVVTDNENAEAKQFFSSNLNYSKKLKKINAQLFIGGQYSLYNENITSNIYNNYNNTQDSLFEYRFQKNRINVATGKIDLEKTFKHETKWETGLNVSSATSNTILNILDYYPPDSLFSKYNYAEMDYAAYTQLSGNIKKLVYTAGLRLENTQVKSGYPDSASLSVDKNYTKLFPKLTIDIPVDGIRTITLNYARSINRPDYSTAVQRTVYINPFFEWANNINIDPSLTDDASATFQYKENSLKLGYYRTTGPVYANFHYDSTKNLLTREDINYAVESGVYLNLIVPVTYKCWTSTNELDVWFDRVKDPSAVFNKVTPYLFLYSSNQFKLPKEYLLSITGWGLPKRYEGIFERTGMFEVDMGLSKMILKKINCSLNFNDIFASAHEQEIFSINNIRSNGVFYDPSNISLTIKYSFGTIRDSKYKNSDVDENISRIK